MGRRLHRRGGEPIVAGVVTDIASAPRLCPHCRKPVRWEGNPSRPFCSKRCRLADLGAWAAERYRVAGEPLGDDDDSGGESTD